MVGFTFCFCYLYSIMQLWSHQSTTKLVLWIRHIQSMSLGISVLYDKHDGSSSIFKIYLHFWGSITKLPKIYNAASRLHNKAFRLHNTASRLHNKASGLLKAAFGLHNKTFGSINKCLNSIMHKKWP